MKMLGVPLADVFSTMKAYTGSVYVNDFNMFNRIYKVYIQAEAPYREHKDNINLFFVKASNGAKLPPPEVSCRPSMNAVMTAPIPKAVPRLVRAGS